jgi:ABC-2 type transport system permease protein
MNATATMVKVELKLASRDIGTAVFGLLFPAALLLVLAALQGFTDPDPDLGGLRLIDIYTPIVLMLTFAIVGVSAVAASLATYRKEGVLRRLRVTPMGPGRLLGAQLIAHLLIALTGSWTSPQDTDTGVMRPWSMVAG